MVCLSPIPRVQTPRVSGEQRRQRILAEPHHYCFAFGKGVKVGKNKREMSTNILSTQDNYHQMLRSTFLKFLLLQGL